MLHDSRHLELNMAAIMARGCRPSCQGTRQSTSITEHDDHHVKGLSAVMSGSWRATRESTSITEHGSHHAQGCTCCIKDLVSPSWDGP